MPEQLSIVTSDAEVVDLNALPGARHLGAVGLGMPPVALVQDEAAGQVGSILRAVRVLARDVSVPLFVEQTSESDLRDLLRELALQLDPTRGDCTLRAVAGDGSSTRDLTVRYTGGLEGDRVTGQRGLTWQKAVLGFRAPDPYWYDSVTTSTTFTVAASPATMLSATFLPLTLSSDTVLGTQVVSNAGDVEAWPIWTIHGPGSNLVLTNTTSGKTLTLNVTLTNAQSVVIDTRPGKKTVKRNDGTNLYGSLGAGSALWSLPRGNNTLTIQLTDATAESYVTLAYKRRWLTS